MQHTKAIKSLYKLAQCCSQTQFHHLAFKIIGQNIQFDLAGWGESIDSIDSVIAVKDSRFKNTTSLLDGYNKLLPVNTVSRERTNCEPIVINMGLDQYDPVQDAELIAWGLKNNIRNSLHTSITYGNNLLAYSVVFWRCNVSPGFSDSDQHCIQNIIPHLIESFRLCRRLDIQRTLTKQRGICQGFAICNQQGYLLDFDDRFIEILTSDYPKWENKCLPEQFTSSLSRCTDKKIKWGFYRWSQLGEMYLIFVVGLDKFQKLSKREFQVAYNYSTGQTYKDIAMKFSIAPVTVRNHISNIYTKLNINSKGMLIQLFE